MLYIDKNRILVDWLTMVSTIDDPQGIIELFGLQNLTFTEFPGYYGYPKRISSEYIHICYGASDEMGVCIIMSGQGCRLYESNGNNDYNYIFDYVIKNKGYVWLTRLDLAYDNFDELDMRIIFADTIQQNYVSRFRSYQYQGSNTGLSVTFGSTSSLIKLRIYDKLAEQEAKVYKTVERPDGIKKWVRLELQFNKERSMELLEALELSRYTDYASIFFGVLSQYHIFKEPGKDKNKSRWNTAEYWKNILYEKIKLFTTDNSPNTVERIRKFVFKQAIGSLKTLAEIEGIDNLANEINDAPWPPNDKYRDLINRVKKEEKGKAN